MRNIKTYRTLFSGFVALAASVAFSGASALDLPAKKQTMAGLYLTAAEAVAFLEDEDVLFVDVRTRAEVNFLGIPTRADVNIPLMFMPPFPEFDADKAAYKLEINEDFAEDFLAYASEAGLTTDTPVVLICRSGSRSARAANILTDLGFTEVYSVVDGYEGDKAGDGPSKGQRVVNGWRNAGLDWSYGISRSQVYPGDTN